MELDLWKDLTCQMLHFQFDLDPGTNGLEEGNRNLGNRKCWKTLRAERSG